MSSKKNDNHASGEHRRRFLSPGRRVIQTCCFIGSTAFIFSHIGEAAIADDSVRLSDRQTLVHQNREADEQPMSAIELPEISDAPVDQLFTECHYCQKQHRRWYSSTADLAHAAAVCGYDYVEVRIDQLFIDNKKAAVLTMVYCAINGSGLTVDSVVCIRRDAQSTVKSVAVGSSFLQRAPSAIATDTAASHCGNGDILRCVAVAGDFNSSGSYDERSHRFRYTFTVGKATYQIDDAGMLQHTREMPHIAGAVVPFRSYYRLGIGNDHVECDSGGTLDQTPFDITVNLRARYVYNQCIVDYDLASEAGIASMHFHAPGLIDTTYTLDRKKKENGSITVGFGKRTHELTVTVTNGSGMITRRVMHLFEKLEQEHTAKKRKNELWEARTLWASENAVHTAVDVISRFEGNLLSALLDIYCEGKAQERFLCIPDRLDDHCAEHFLLPSDGRAPFTVAPACNRQAVYTYHLHMKADSVVRNGSIITCAIYGLSTRAVDTGSINLTFTFPLGEGYYLPKWSAGRSTINRKEIYPSIVVCSKIAATEGGIRLSNVPLITKTPMNDLEYATLITSIAPDDTLSLTYVAIGLDRSHRILYRTIYGATDKIASETLTSDGIKLHIATKIISTKDHGRMYISRENISTPEKCVVLSIFVYSFKHRATTAVGGWWSHW